MELIALILCSFLVFAASNEEKEIPTTSSETTSNGNSSNTEQKLMRDCCSLPTPTASSLYLTCQGNQSHENQSDLKCFAKKIIKNGVIDQEKVVESLQHDPAWRDFVRLAVANCKYSPYGNLNGNLAKYYDCISETLTNDCIRFIPHLECIPTFDQFLRNKFVYENCTEWPKDFVNPVICCDTPTLYSGNLNCELKCRKTEFLHSEKRHCQEKCALEAEGFVTQDGKVDFAAVKKVLLEKTINNTAQHDLVDGVVVECENASKDTAMSAVALEVCLRQKFTSKCVKFGTTYSCGLIKNFMKQCPNVKLPF